MPSIACAVMIATGPATEVNASACGRDQRGFVSGKAHTMHVRRRGCTGKGLYNTCTVGSLRVFGCGAGLEEGEGGEAVDGVRRDDAPQGPASEINTSARGRDNGGFAPGQACTIHVLAVQYMYGAV